MQPELFGLCGLLLRKLLDFSGTEKAADKWTYVNSMVSEVTIDENGKATGVKYINRKTADSMASRAGVVILAASACSTARILLNSKSEKFPNGFRQ